MKVIIYAALFAAVLAVLGIIGALAENETIGEKFSRALRCVGVVVEGLISLLTLPVEAVATIFERY